jgi:hypothetical protein
MTRGVAVSHQDRESGYWAADSMNKQYEADSMPSRFMQDAATAFAALGLLGPPSNDHRSSGF